MRIKGSQLYVRRDAVFDRVESHLALRGQDELGVFVSKGMQGFDNRGQLWQEQSVDPCP